MFPSKMPSLPIEGPLLASDLSYQEQELLMLLLEGSSHDVLRERLSPKVNHDFNDNINDVVRNICGKLGVEAQNGLNRLHLLMAYALRENFVPEPKVLREIPLKHKQMISQVALGMRNAEIASLKGFFSDGSTKVTIRNYVKKIGNPDEDPKINGRLKLTQWYVEHAIDFNNPFDGIDVSNLPKFSKRDWDIALLIGQGYSRTLVSEELGELDRNVHKRTMNIFNKIIKSLPFDEQESMVNRNKDIVIMLFTRAAPLSNEEVRRSIVYGPSKIPLVRLSVIRQEVANTLSQRRAIFATDIAKISGNRNSIGQVVSDIRSGKFERDTGVSARVSKYMGKLIISLASMPENSLEMPELQNKIGKKRVKVRSSSLFWDTVRQGVVAKLNQGHVLIPSDIVLPADEKGSPTTTRGNLIKAMRLGRFTRDTGVEIRIGKHKNTSIISPASMPENSPEIRAAKRRIDARFIGSSVRWARARGKIYP